MNLRLTVDGKERFAWAFRTLGEAVSDWRGVWPEIQMYFFRANMEQFRSLGARGGQTWAPLSDSYSRWKEKKYPGKPILVRTERLKRSLTATGSGSDQVYQAEPMSLTLGTMVPYGIFHQRGTKTMARRSVIEPTKRDMGRIVSRMYRFAERGARDAGFKTQKRAFDTPGAE